LDLHGIARQNSRLAGVIFAIGAKTIGKGGATLWKHFENHAAILLAERSKERSAMKISKDAPLVLATLASWFRLLPIHES